ncbi:PAS domain S-box-containing protein [Salegentibacter sp. 24]|uniref:response regulator n=1 Tax=Salegentibacter sp. 24 TaxID=2183986 RepID=UPI001060F62D|nr:response regulator [Salegentibacter sp. 24]TDN95005.1 PAS domain S-box-containing protein [Salegentibacter sp. 24]
MYNDKYQYRILLIEDNDGDYLLVSEILKEIFSAHVLTRLASYASVKELQNSLQFDVVLLDLSLPDKQGTELLRLILEQFPLTPIIALTGYAQLEFAKESLALGIADYLIKENTTAVLLFKSIIYCLERFKNIAALARSELLYSDLFNFNPQPTWVYDLQTLKFLDVNCMAVTNYGYSKEEFLNMTLKDIRPAKDYKRLEVFVKLLKYNGEGINDRIFTHIKKNKEKIRVKIESKIIDYKGKKAVIVVANDITSHLNHLEIIEKQNEELRHTAWLQSHVVRAPVAKILAITNQLTEDHLSIQDQKFLLGALTTTTEELDNNIRKVVERTEKIFEEDASSSILGLN